MLFCSEHSIEAVLSCLLQGKSSEFLCELLNSLTLLPPEYLTAYVPQLVLLAVRSGQHTTFLEFFRNSALNSHSFGLVLFWYLSACSTDSALPFSTELTRYTTEIEKSIVNGFTDGRVPPHLYCVALPEAPKYFAAHKEIRANYFAEQHNLAHWLLNISMQLAAYTEDQRTPALRRHLSHIEARLVQLRKKYAGSDHSEYTKRLFRGIILPINFANSADTEQIVRIDIANSHCFSSKARVPYRLMIETLGINEPDLEYARKERSLIVKSSDDLRQEALAMQVIRKAQQVFAQEHLPLFLRPYEILVVTASAGLIEAVPHCESLHALKQRDPSQSLLQLYKAQFGGAFEEARMNFIKSMAGYSLLCFLLNVKDRHNGNILVDQEGYVIHIDFGFFLTHSPGGNASFESAPFKLTREMVELMNGHSSEYFIYYKVLMWKGLLALRRHVGEFTVLLEIAQNCSSLQCFREPAQALEDFTARFFPGRTDEECRECIESLVKDSAESWKTAQYDTYQWLVHGIQN